VVDGCPIAVTGVRNGVRFDLRERVPLGEPPTGHSGTVYSVACAVVDSWPIAVTGRANVTVRLWDLGERQEVERIDLPAKVRSITISADNYLLPGSTQRSSCLSRRRDDDDQLARRGRDPRDRETAG